MRGLLAIMLVALLGCIAAVASPSWLTVRKYEITPGNLMEATPLYPKRTKLHEVDRSQGDDPITKFMLTPNSFQICACMTQGENVICVCTEPEAGVCAETQI